MESPNQSTYGIGRLKFPSSTFQFLLHLMLSVWSVVVNALKCSKDRAKEVRSSLTMAFAKWFSTVVVIAFLVRFDTLLLSMLSRVDSTQDRSFCDHGALNYFVRSFSPYDLWRFQCSLNSRSSRIRSERMFFFGVRKYRSCSISHWAFWTELLLDELCTGKYVFHLAENILFSLFEISVALDWKSSIYNWRSRK